jgi:glycosyltransferase involved in cell wall biosynthesis
MDDVPAGPASPGPRRPSLSVVVPVRNGGRDFERCLQRLRDSLLTDFELIVVDDGSTDGSAAIAQAAGAIVIHNATPTGPAAARNQGAQAASAPLIFFLDADVAVHRTTLVRAHARFTNDPTLAALFGSYDDQPAAPGVVSQYRNLLHHFVHQTGSFVAEMRPAHTFWTGCGTIRRDVFLEFGGFDPRLYPRPAIEDIELGYRLTRAGRRIVLARDVQATHLKRWTLAEMIRTDIFRRGVPWMLLIKRTGTTETDLNVNLAQKACVALTGLTIVALFATALVPYLAFGAVAALAAIVALNHRFFGFLAGRRGPIFAVAAVPLHLVYYCCCGLSVVIAQWHWRLRKSGLTHARAVRSGRADAAEVARPHLAGNRSPRRQSQA